MDDKLRASLPGSFIKLNDGITHYHLDGPENGRVVVLINGFSIPLYLWDHTFQALIDAGYRVLRFDFYGRGYSDRPALTYNADLHDRQIHELLQALHISTPVHMIGCSMGGIISAMYCDRHPEMVERLVLIDPAGTLPQISPFLKLIKIPLLGELILNFRGDDFLLPGMAGDLSHPEKFPEYVSLYEPQMKIRGFKRAILSTLRCGFLQNQEQVYRRLGRQNRPILLIWGEEDQTIPFTVSDQLCAFLPGVHFYPISQVGHVPHYENPERVNPIILKFLDNYPDCVIEERA
ncbi:MAG: alpha/beta hydrolase [Anaerolineae bacterium]|nr:alpha/beta hydrolase [Anaerolineae bacterium]